LLFTNSAKYTTSANISLGENDLNKNFQYNLRQTLNDGSCRSITVFISPAFLPNRTLREDALLNRDQESDKYHKFSFEMGSRHHLSCVNGMSNSYFPNGDFKVRWWLIYFNEDGTFHEVQELKEYELAPNYSPNFSKNHSITIDQVNFWNPGIYTCEIEYNRRKMFASHTHMCVKQRTIPIDPSLSCCGEYAISRGSSLHIKCLAYVDTQVGSERDFQVIWFKKTSQPSESATDILCKNERVDSNHKVDRASCKFVGLTNKEKTCFDYVPEENEIVDVFENVDVHFWQKNMRRSDAGLIYVQVKHRGRYSEAVPIRLKY